MIHRVKCRDCNVNYFGQTKRSFHIKKKNISKKIVDDSSTFQKNDTHDFDWKHFDVLNIERIQTGRNITEML